MSSTRGLDWRVVNVAFATGLAQRHDDRARPSIALDIAKNIQFDEQGGVQTRKPFGSTMTDIAGGGTVSTARRLFVSGDELLLFTKDTLYSWNAQLSRWVSKGTHLAVKVAEQTVYATNGDQIHCDRAELSGMIYFAWEDADKVYVAAQDKTTGSVFMQPTAVGGAGTRPRLVALTTKVLLFWHAGTSGAAGNIEVYVIDPTNSDPSDLSTDLATPTINGTVLAAAANGQYYDAVKVNGADQAIVVCRRLVTTSYEIAKVSNAGAVSASTKARVATGPIAVSTDPTGATAQVIRENAVAIQGDRITVSSLADAATGQAIGTAVGAGTNHIAVCHRSVQDSGAYRAYVFWSDGEANDFTNWYSNVNYVDTAGTIGTEAPFVRRAAVASRAFDHDGRVFVALLFAGESGFTGGGSAQFRSALQSTLFVYRDDGLLVAKVATNRGPGVDSVEGWLPGVQSLGSGVYSWCATERRRVPTGNTGQQEAYADRGPREVVLTFDSNEARRCVRLGETVYITGGEIMQYDGAALYEVGFHIFPWSFGAAEVATGNLADGVYTYKQTLRFENAKGESDRSTTATYGNVTIAGGPNGVTFTVSVPLHITHKQTTKPIEVEVWRTAVNPGSPDVPLYKVTSNDPGVTANPNRYLPNAPTSSVLATLNDELADSVLTAREASPENAGEVENNAPPAATIIAATDTRIFLAGVASDPDRVWYSKQRNAGEIAAFHEALTVNVPRPGGSITAIAVREDALYVWRETATYVFPGYGFDNLGGGQNYGPVQTLSTDVGAMNQESVALTDRGYIFKSSKGWMVLNGRSVEYIGAAVSDYDSEVITSIAVLEGQHQIRCLSASRMLVFDTVGGQWFEWTISDGLDACVWQGLHTYLTATGAKVQSTSYSGLTYGMDVETAWLKLDDLQGASAVKKVQPVGAWQSSFGLRVRIAYDYRISSSGTPVYVDDKTWFPEAIDVGDLLQLKHGPRRQKCEAIKVRLTAVAASSILTASEVICELNGGTDWTATLFGIVPRAFSINFVTGTTVDIDVRDNERWNGTAWVAAFGTCGVKVTGNNTTATVTISDVEDAINASSDLVTVLIPHGVPSATINMTAMVIQGESLASFDEAFPTGEALKLTGIGLEVGSEGGLYRRIAASQKQ